MVNFCKYKIFSGESQAFRKNSDEKFLRSNLLFDQLQ